jgi:phage-related baseplate assembly protein
MAEFYVPKTQEQCYTALKNYLLGKGSTLNNFNDGSRLNTIIEAISLLSGENQNDFYQAFLAAIPVAIYNGFNFKRKAGNYSVGTLTFNRSVNALQDYSIPAGTAITLNGIQYVTTQIAYILTGSATSGAIAATCAIIGKNDISVGAINTLTGLGSFINQPEGVESCINADAFVNGTNEESDADRLTRFQLYISSLSKSTVIGIYSAVASIDGVKSVNVIEYFPTDGWVTIYADDGTGTLSTALYNEIIKTVNGDITDPDNYPGCKAAGIHIQVLAPTITSISITAVLYALATSTTLDNTFIINATNLLEQYTNSLVVGADWIRNVAESKVIISSNDIYDFKISTPSDNVAIAADRLAKTGTIVITVVRV